MFPQTGANRIMERQCRKSDVRDGRSTLDATHDVDSFPYSVALTAPMGRASDRSSTFFYALWSSSSAADNRHLSTAFEVDLCALTAAVHS